MINEELIDFYNVGNKPRESFLRQLAHSGPAIQLNNFLSLDEVELLKYLESVHPVDRREVRPPDDRVAFTYGPWHEDSRADFLRDRLHEQLGPFEIWGGNYFDIPRAYLPHVDNGEGLRNPNYKNIILPLRLDPPETQTNLVLFRQRYFGDNTGFLASGESLDRASTANASLHDYSRILNLEESLAIDPAFLKKELGHIDPRNLNGFSVEKVIPWTVGSCIVFDSSQIHCSSDFRTTGLSRKLGLSLFTFLPEDSL